MKTAQLQHHAGGGWTTVGDVKGALDDAQLVLLFGDRHRIAESAALDQLRTRFPAATVVSCSTGAEIVGNTVLEGTLTATALRFDSTRVVAVEKPLREPDESFATGYALARDLPADGLRHVLVFSEGLRVNGSALAEGMAAGLPAGVTVSGGLAGDGERFEVTLVGVNGAPQSGRVAAVGLYGDRLRVGMGSLGGWDTGDREFLITRSRGNVLFELDGRPALTVYRELIGAHAYALPASGLLFPLNVVSPEGESGVVRTLLAINEDEQSITCAGDLPEGRKVRLMKANLDRLIDAAGGAATRSLSTLGGAAPDFVLLVSCIGRKLLLQQRTRDELLSARAVFGSRSTFAGFYSYGELSPMTPSARCELHNQTMTITTLTEG